MDISKCPFCLSSDVRVESWPAEPDDPMQSYFALVTCGKCGAVGPVISDADVPRMIEEFPAMPVEAVVAQVAIHAWGIPGRRALSLLVSAFPDA
jgi:hypothetical protein